MSRRLIKNADGVLVPAEHRIMTANGLVPVNGDAVPATAGVPAADTADSEPVEPDDG